MSLLNKKPFRWFTEITNIFKIVYSQALNLDITEPLYYKVLSITYDIIHPNNSEINGTEP